MTLRVCFFGDAQSEHTQRWVKEIAERGFETFLVTNRPANLPFTTIVELPEGRGGKLSWFFRVRDIRRIVREISPDVVHGHYITSYGFWAAACGVRPLVLTAWGSDILISPKQSRLIRWITGWAVSKADLITADAEDVLDEISLYSPSGSLEQIQWGVDLNRYQYRSPERSSSDEITFVSLRSWEELYNIRIIIQAFSKVLKRESSKAFHMHLLGGGSQECELVRLAEKLGIEKKITFHGRVDESRMLSILKDADVSISVPESDGTAMSLLESMAIGLPVIVSDLPANRQWMDQTGGCVVPAGDVDSLTEAMIYLSGEQALRVKMGMRNRTLIERKADRAKEMDRMAELYNRLVEDF